MTPKSIYTVNGLKTHLGEWICGDLAEIDIFLAINLQTCNFRGESR